MTGRTRSCHNRPTGSRMDQRRGLSALRRVPFSRVYPTPRWSVSPARASGRSSKPARQFVQYQDPSTDAFFLTAGKLRVIVYSLEGTAVYSSPPGPKPPARRFPRHPSSSRPSGRGGRLQRSRPQDQAAATCADFQRGRERGRLSATPVRINLPRRGAAYVDSILKGEKPANLPVQRPRRSNSPFRRRCLPALTR